MLRSLTRPDRDVTDEVRHALTEFAGRGRWGVTVDKGDVRSAIPTGTRRAGPTSPGPGPVWAYGMADGVIGGPAAAPEPGSPA